MSIIKGLTGWTVIVVVVLLVVAGTIFRGSLIGTLAWIAAGAAALVGAINTASYGWGQSG